jgi:DNA-directed RNA polymerase subunit RPC12/RpoP
MSTLTRTRTRERHTTTRPRCIRCKGWVRFEDDIVTREWACLNCGYRGDQVLAPARASGER